MKMLDDPGVALDADVFLVRVSPRLVWRVGVEEAAMAAIRAKDVYLVAQYARLRPRRGRKKALGAVKHSILIACWHMLYTGELYHDLGGDYFRKRVPERITKRLVAQLESLGHKVILEELPQAA